MEKQDCFFWMLLEHPCCTLSFQHVISVLGHKSRREYLHIVAVVKGVETENGKLFPKALYIRKDSKASL